MGNSRAGVFTVHAAGSSSKFRSHPKYPLGICWPSHGALSATGFDVQNNLLRRWTAVMTGLLIAATWRLWTLTSEFPAVPLFSSLCELPPEVDWLFLAALCSGLAVMSTATAKLAKLGMLVVVASGSGLIALDQHRCQPWFYQLLLFCLLWLICEARQAQRFILWIVISVYFYSALGKLDFEFLHTVGQDFWSGGARLVRLRPEVPQATSLWLIALLPLTELVIAAGLMFRSTRRVAGSAACVLHLGLVVLLGPLGLNHSRGVVLWNFQFAVQALLLFVLATRTDSIDVLPNTQSVGRLRLGWAVALLAIGMPVLERFGLWDHWASWALYAPHSSRTEIWVASTFREYLPGTLRDELQPETELTLWIRLPIERWSLEQVSAPIYPQARFQMGVALALTRTLQSEYAVRVIVRSVSSRMDGSRKSSEYVGLSNIESAADSFWLNARPRTRRDMNWK